MSTSTRQTNRRILGTIALAAVYAVTGIGVLSLPEATLELRRMIWLPSGIALAWLILGGVRLWPGVAIGAALTTALSGGTPLFVLATAVANTGEILLLVWIFERAGIGRRLQSRIDLITFTLALVVATALSSVVSVGTLALTSGLRSPGELWFMWWLTHVMGCVVLTPLILSFPGISPAPPRIPFWEAAAICIGLAVTLSISFTPIVPASVSSLPLTFLSFPFLIWSAYRCGQFGASSASFAAAAFALVGTLAGIGPFTHVSPNTSLVLTLVYVCAAEFSTLFVAGLVAERTGAQVEQERLERRVRRSEKLESLGALAGGIAHDFNNLLVAIMGNVDLILMDTDPSDPTYDALDQSVRASERATELCRQLLAYAGQGPYERSVVDLSSVVSEITSLLRVTVPKGTVLNYDLAPEDLPVMADTGQLRRVILNLFANAGDALGVRRGQITVRTYAALDANWYRERGVFYLDPPEGPVAVLEVEDTGEGIAADNLERIFDPVFTTRGAGRGLGLASVLGIVRGHGGALNVRSELGAGTVFTLIFPLEDAPIDTVPTPPIPDLERRTGAVLVVDDEPSVRRAAVALVRRLGYQVVEASDGHAALEAVAEHGDVLTCILLDITMPGMSGVEVLREIRQSGRDIPVLLSSGYVLSPIEVLAEYGPARFLPKPYTLSGLEDAIDELLHSTSGLTSPS
ncbi:MAG: MASE1 domain-containing protein [Gemmatimonadota bacterium]|nr:MASE1 domain-containing protein [Gemmatimonadota bacterium]